MLIVWDRLFGSLQGETEPVRYGLTENIETPAPARFDVVRAHAKRIDRYEPAACPARRRSCWRWRRNSSSCCHRRPGRRRADVRVTSG
jgi:hypothetical protein